MRRIVVIGKTDATINLNKIGVPIRGRIKAVLNIENIEQENELMGIVRAGYLEIIPEPSVIPVMPAINLTNYSVPTPTVVVKTEDKPTEDAPKKKGGRPKGSTKAKMMAKNPQAIEEGIRVANAEAKTQRMGSKVTIGSPGGALTGRMTRSAVNDITESEHTKASIEAMEKLEKEEAEDITLEDDPIDESKLNPSDQMGRKATVANHGVPNSVEMTNSIIPESKSIKEVDPFIDKTPKADEEDPFIEI